jgi:hypothetical protein
MPPIIPRELSERIDAMLALLEAGVALAAAPASAAPVPTSDHVQERASADRPTRLTGDIRRTIPGVTDILMVDISDTGVVIETRRPLNSGMSANLVVRFNGKRHNVRAMATRSALHAITPNSEVIYRTTLQFDRPLVFDEAP